MNQRRIPVFFKYVRRELRLSRLAVVLVGTALMTSACSSLGIGGSSEVSIADLEKAASSAMECLREAGIDGEITIGDTGYQGVGFTVSEDAGIAWEQERAVDECILELEELDFEYMKTRIPTGADRDREMADMLACFESVGVTSITATDPQNVIVGKLMDHEMTLTGNNSPFGPGVDCLDNHEALFPERFGLEPVN